MKKVLVIGGGFAGLSAAVYLSKYGFKVKLLEAAPRLGGRAYSFKDEITGDIIDNGQHIMMGCYQYTLDFLKITENIDNLFIQKKFRVIFSHKKMSTVPFSAVTGIYPLNLMLGVLRLRTLSWKERLSVLKFFLRLKFVHFQDLNLLSVKEWLEREGQSSNTIKALWEIITVGALNTCTSQASASMFSDVLRKIFFMGSKAAAIIIPSVGLSEMYCTRTEKYIRSRGGDVCLSSRVDKIIFENDRAVSVIVDNVEHSDFDYIIAAVPFFGINKLLNNGLIKIDHFTPSSILSVHIWLNENPFEEKFYGLIDSEVQWIFNHKSYITVVISNAGQLQEMNRDEIFRLIIKNISEHFPFFTVENVKTYKIIKEKRATFIPNNIVLSKRPDVTTDIHNFFLAGDWINTGLPATIESAVKSGRLAAEAVIHSNK